MVNLAREAVLRKEVVLQGKRHKRCTDDAFISSSYAANVYARCFTQILCLITGRLECLFGLQIYSVHLLLPEGHVLIIFTPAC